MAANRRAVVGWIDGRIVPHVRVGRERWTPRAKRYRADQDRLEVLLREAFDRAGVDQAGAPWALRVWATFAPAKSTGEIPKTCGDVDNIAKSVADALQRSGCTPDDCHMHKLEARKLRVPTRDQEGIEWAVYWTEDEGDA